MWIIDPNAGDGREWLSVLDGQLEIAVELDNSEQGFEDNIKLVFQKTFSRSLLFFALMKPHLG